MKKTLLIAAAALAASVISSQAQVYSQNIVGYVNKVFVGSQYNALANPFNAGVTNGANEVFPGGLPDGTQLFQWNGTGYDISGYDSSIGVNPANWYDGGFSVVAATPVIKPGQGFFLLPPSNFTNTYVGTVAIATGATGTNSATANQYNMLGSLLPVAGSVSNAIVNFFPPDGTQLFQWTGNGYLVSGYDASIGASAANWYDGGFSVVAPVPTITVGEGYFVLPPTTYKWVQGL